MSTAQQMISTQSRGETLRTVWYDVIITLLLCVDCYHIFNYYHQSATSTSIGGAIFDVFLAMAIASLAFALKPATILFTNSYRLKDPILERIGTAALLGTLIFGIYIATVSSLNTNTEVRDRSVTTYDSSLVALETQETTAKSKLNLALLTAKNTTPERAEVITAAAWLSYNREMTRIAQERTKTNSAAPLKQVHDAGVIAVTDSFRNTLFSLFITLAGVALTIFKVLHLKSENRIPAFSLAPKLNHAWESSKENFRSENFKVNPIKGIFSGLFFGHKQDVVDEDSRLSDPRVINGTATSKNEETSDKPTKKQPAAVDPQSDDGSISFMKSPRFLTCPHCQTKLKASVDLLTKAYEFNKANDITPSLCLKCGSCEERFDAIKCQTKQRPAQKEINRLQPDSIDVSTDLEWITHHRTQVENYEGVPTYSLETPVPFHMFPDFQLAVLSPCKTKALYWCPNLESRAEWDKAIQAMAFLNDNHPLKKEVMLFIGGIREYKRLAAEDPTQGNNRESAGIPDSSPKLPLNNQQSMTDGKEEETNGNNAGNTETSGKQAGNRALDFASICQNSSIEDRLKMLSDHIDELSKDPTNHGRTCSPTLAFKKIPGRYDFVQDLFAAKLKEGKLAKKGNKYIINHTGTAA